MDFIYALCLILGLNLYICMVIYLSKKKQMIWGLIFPFIMSGISIWRIFEYIQYSSRHLNSQAGVSMICSLILAIFGFILFTVVRYGEEKQS